MGFSLQSEAAEVAKVVCKVWRKSLISFECRQWFSQEDGISCGAVAVAHAALVVGGQQATSLQALRRLQSCLMPSGPSTCLHAGRGGLTAKEAQTLSELLVSKGVPSDKAAERSQDLVKKIGQTTVVQALNAKQPWQALKAAASRPGTAFRIISPTELEAKIREKAVEEHGAAVPNGGRKKRRQVALSKAAAPLIIDPQSLLLTDGSFCTQDGTGLHQIPFEEVTNEAHGLAFCTAEQALPFLQGDPLSTDPLCLVTTSEVPTDITTKRQHVPVRYPVIFQPTQEPILINGSLINLGDESVSLAQGTIAEPTSLATGVIKLAVYKDEYAGDWSKFIQGPVKHILQSIQLQSALESHVGWIVLHFILQSKRRLMPCCSMCGRVSSRRTAAKGLIQRQQRCSQCCSASRVLLSTCCSLSMLQESTLSHALTQELAATQTGGWCGSPGRAGIRRAISSKRAPRLWL